MVPMMGKRRAVFILLLILSFVLVSFPQIGAVKAESIPYIYIRADGSIEGTDKIQQTGNIYSFTDNMRG
jgi:hypothetical protein